MLGAYFSPLAPAVLLLLSALILSVLFPRLPARWQAHRGIQYFGAPVLVGLAFLTLLGSRLTLAGDTAGQGLEMLSGWNFFTAESAAALTVRTDPFSLAFLILTLLILLAVTLAQPALAPSPNGQARSGDVAGWLVMAAGACLLFVSANGLTIGYAVLIFDLCTAIYWLQRGRADLSVARLFLGIFTTSGLALAAIDNVPGTFLLVLALWLRLGGYPFIEATLQAARPDYGRLVYLALSLTVGLYLVMRSLPGPLPEMVRWLVLITMLLNGLLVWLTGQRSTWLTRLALTEALLILLVGPLAEEFATAYAVGLILSLVALWITPRLGKPQLTESAWSWPYLPAVGATLTLVGLPLSLGWPARSMMYQSLLLLDNAAMIIGVILAEGLALSGLVRYWLIVWSEVDKHRQRSVAGIVAMVPFLIPGLGPFILATITRTELPLADFDHPSGLFIAMIVAIAGAVGLGYFRPQIIDWLKISPTPLAEFLYLRWLLSWLEELLYWLGKAVLRVMVFFEGQHYMGWALFTALVSVLIILLGT